MTSCGNGDGDPATGGSPDTLNLEAPAFLGRNVTVVAQDPATPGENAWGSTYVPGPDTVTRCSVAGRPTLAATRSEISNLRVAGLTAPFRTATTLMVVCPSVPVAGDDVTDRVNPSTLPVAGCPDGMAPVVVVDVPPVDDVGAWVVVDALPVELEHPASRVSPHPRSATKTGAFEKLRIGSWYRPPHVHR